jgi:hypothetical protein
MNKLPIPVRSTGGTLWSYGAMKTNNLNTWFLPPVTTKAEAKSAAYQGFWAAVIVAVITVLFAVITLVAGSMEDVPIDAWSFIDAGIFVAIAIYIRKLSRVAAVFGLVMYWLGRIHMWSVTGFGSDDVTGIWMILLLTCAFINGIRGTVAYHRLAKSLEMDS